MAELKLWLLRATRFTPNFCGEIAGVFTSPGGAKQAAEALYGSKYPNARYEWRGQIVESLYPIVPEDWEQISEFEIVPMMADKVILK